jgi:hypothetical protein
MISFIKSTDFKGINKCVYLFINKGKKSTSKFAIPIKNNDTRTTHRKANLFTLFLKEVINH